MSIFRLCTVSAFAWLLFFGLRLPVGGHPTASAGGCVLGPQPPALSSGLGIDVLGIPTGNNVPGLPGPDIDANRYGPGVLVGFGQVVYDQVDMVIQGRDAVTTLVIARRHLSRRNQENSIFGPAWAFNYRHTIERVGDDVVMESFGRKDLFVAVAGATAVWEGIEGRFDRLTYDTVNATYTLRMPHGTVLEFEADNAATSTIPGHLTRITSPNGNTLIFSYETAANQPDILKRKLLTIIDSFGRAIEFFYTNAAYAAGVSKIRDFTGREVLYHYNGAGQLLTVRSPVVASTGNLNDFQAGKTYAYTYRNHADPELQHALTSVIFPNQHAADDDPPRCQWTYRDRVASDPFFGYLEQYTLGNQSVPVELKAGGSFFYRYKTLGEIKNDLNEPVWEIAVTDRRNTKTNYKVNRLGHVLSEAISNQFRGGPTKAYIKGFTYNADGQITKSQNPLGNKTEYIYANRREHPHNANRKIPRNSEINLTSTLRFPDQRGARQPFIRNEVVYDPVFNQAFKETAPRGFDAQEKRTTSESDATLRQRFTTTYLYDYMEYLPAAATHFAPILGLTPTELQALFTDAEVIDLAADVNGDILTNQHFGNLVKTNYPDVPRPKSAGENLGLRVGLLGDAEQADERFRYNQFGQLIHHRDAEENVTTTAYYGANDPDGDGTADVSGADITTGGYLRSVVRDAEDGAGRNSGQNPEKVGQTTTYEYKAQGTFPKNLRGVPTAEINPRGIKTTYLVNELDQVVKTVSAADVSAATEPGLTAFAYESITIYDHNDNVVETRIQNKDTLNIDNDFIVQHFAFDILDQERSELLNADAASDNVRIKNEVAYDASENPVEEIFGANNPITASDYAKVTVAVDERDFPAMKTLAVGEGETEAAFEYQVDDDGDDVKEIDGEDADITPGMTAAQKAVADAADGAVGGDVTNIKYDGFGRQIEVTDRAGNRTTYQYDSASNLRSIQSVGSVDHTAPDQRLLARTDTRYDERNRAFRTDHHIFQYNGKRVGSIDAGALDPSNLMVSTVTLYDRLGRVVGTVDAENDTYSTRYDGLSRVVTTIDPLNNEVRNSYDFNDNLVQVQEIERSSLISSDEIFTTFYTYDALDRQTKVIDPNGQTTTYRYDSRNNQIKSIDQLGNEAEMRYDRFDRLVETRSYLSTDGLNASSTNKDAGQSDDGVITIKQEWDKLNRLTAQIDDKGNRTEYVYDDLNRKVRAKYQDGTFETWRYNDDSELLEHVDQNGTRETYAYDAKSRRTRLNVLLGPNLGGLGGTSVKTWGYDGLDRTTLATDDNGGAGNTVAYTYVYDSLSRQLRETQAIATLPTLNVDSEWQGASRKVSGTYPNGRKVNRSYDALDRWFEIKEATDNSLISRFEYVGPSRDLRTTYGNGAVLDKRNGAGTQTTSGANAGYDANRRDVRHEWKTGAGEQITAYVNTWNGPTGVGTNRRASETREHLKTDNTAKTDTYTFDSTYRMTGFRRDGTGLGVGGTASTRTLNGADKTASLSVGSNPFAIDLGAHDQFAKPNDEYSKMNQYKAFGGKSRTYDDNSNLDADGTFKYIQDYNNRIIEIRRAAGDSVVAKYTYDSNNRRVLRDVGGTKTRYIYDGWQVVEERDGNNVVVHQYVDGRDIDEHLQIKDVAADNVFYYHSNSQGFVGALTDGTGAAVEFHEYSWLGKPTILGADKTTTLTTSIVNNPYFFQGRQLDPETATASSPGLFYFRNRYYSPDTGEFLTIDPLGYWNHEQGNGFSAFGEDGWNNEDPFGENRTAKKAAAKKAAAKKAAKAAAKTPATKKAAEKAAAEKAAAEKAAAEKAALESMGRPRGMPRLKYRKLIKGRPQIPVGPYATRAVKLQQGGAAFDRRNFTAEQRRQVNEIGEKTGCHTCGKKTSGWKTGNFTPDHQPPIAMHKAAGGSQFLFPHCRACTSVQGGQVRSAIAENQ